MRDGEVGAILKSFPVVSERLKQRDAAEKRACKLMHLAGGLMSESGI